MSDNLMGFQVNELRLKEALKESVWMCATKRECGPGPITCYSTSRRALESQRTKGTAEEEIRLY